MSVSIYFARLKTVKNVTHMTSTFTMWLFSALAIVARCLYLYHINRTEEIALKWPHGLIIGYMISWGDILISTGESHERTASRRI